MRVMGMLAAQVPIHKRPKDKLGWDTIDLDFFRGSFMPLRVFSLCLLLGISLSLSAQKEPRESYEVYGGYTFLSNSFNGVPGARQPLNGWDTSVGFPPWHNLRFKAEVFGYRGSNLGAAQNAFIIVGGGQYSRHIGKESVFVEVLAGEQGMNRYWGANKTPGAIASFSSILGGGLDTPITRHLAFRVAADYQWENLALIIALNNDMPIRPPGLPNNFGRISTGCVLRF
jgi:hypothetical protein